MQIRATSPSSTLRLSSFASVPWRYLFRHGPAWPCLPKEEADVDGKGRGLNDQASVSKIKSFCFEVAQWPRRVCSV